jgi:hypothetical protein
MTQPSPPEWPHSVQQELYEGDAVVRPFLALIFEFDDRARQDFDDHGDCQFREIAPVPFLKAGVIQVIGTDKNRPAAVDVYGICGPCAELYGDGLAGALRIWWEGWCREKLPPCGVY